MLQINVEDNNYDDYVILYCDGIDSSDVKLSEDDLRGKQITVFLNPDYSSLFTYGRRMIEQINKLTEMNGVNNITILPSNDKFNFHKELNVEELLYENYDSIKHPEMINVRTFDYFATDKNGEMIPIHTVHPLPHCKDIDKKIELLNSPGAAYQDTAFAFITFALADSIYLIEDNTIYYRIDSEMSSSNSNNKVFDIFNETDYIREILIKNSLEKYLPLLARTKMQGQAWIYNRIGDEKKTEFMVRWHEDAIKDYVQGNIRKEYWDDETWLRINEVIFNPYNLRQLERNTPKEQTIKQQLVCLLRDIPNIYILGKGTYAISLANILAKYDVDITAFVVLNVTGDNILQEGKIPVVSLETISRDDILLKGVLEGDDLLKEARMRFYSVCDLRYHLME